MLIKNANGTKYDVLNFEMTYCHDTPCEGVVL